MKFRESGMPKEEMWETFFDPESILTKLGLRQDCDLVLDVGCGYGTFLIPAAKHIRGKIVGLDIDPEMLSICKQKIKMANAGNIELQNRDIYSNGYGLENETVDCVFLFNLLHCEEPEKLLRDTHKVLKKNGQLFIIHWIYDETTPRGPSLDIRPKPNQVVDWATAEGFLFSKIVAVEKYHYGLVLYK